MSFVKFVFSFLFVRNWYTGEKELSRPRLAIFCTCLFLLFLAITMITILQAPVTYVAP
jgi:hypothetical protein